MNSDTAVIERADTSQSVNAVVLSGGASLGAAQVGMLRAIIEAQTPIDVLVGTSVGAFNAAWLAGHPDEGVEELADIWCTLRRRDVFPTNPWRSLAAVGGRTQSLSTDAGLRRLLTRHLTFSEIEDAPIPLHVVAVDVQSGRNQLLSSGLAADAIVASASIPGLLPPVAIGRRWYMDGGVVNNTPISYAASLGAAVVWVLPAGYPCALVTPPRSAIAMAMQGLSTLVQHRLALDALLWHDHVRLMVVPPLCPISISPIDFSHARELIDVAYHSTSSWLAAGCPTEIESLYPHEHDPTGARRPL